ncbi:MAG: hypothetical protein AVDCRST_MAG56-5516 [uncultured Cytophagales bacterium]|uniref:Uncharacterized protein n=1 Tax=uncultured Cytophagales bacterium TaxID=158755 RepID=A0A6J4KCI7_9SPHI|nr:MAG: hypothetical protein AVDCRST_MAG56-5516 [uncultured Cytophagales bacterium]
MKATIPLLVFLLLSVGAAAQDVLVKRNGDEIKAKVLTITPSEITYLLPVNPQDSAATPAAEHTIARRDVFMVKYENGVKEVFEDQGTSQGTGEMKTVAYEPEAKPVAVRKENQAEMFQRGKFDATNYYHGYTGAATGTLIVSLLSPVFGLIPAIACSAAPPAPQTLHFPSYEHYKDGSYQMGYRQQAHRMKAGRVWRNWGIGLGVNVALIVLVTR